jgi:hypothetical protein
LIAPHAEQRRVLHGIAKGETEMSAATMAQPEKKTLNTVPLDWNEVYYTNCPLVSASNVDQQLGWTKEHYKKIGVEYFYLRSRAENWV